ncbi:hypothetical protein I4U23_006262 [Adineta vaga]|nr:hypothetical protein I4U23_006262 [Adineta vaga]
MGNAGTQAPTTPLSDVTSSLKPTDNGKNCSLPYKVSPYTWDMYFCNNGYCQTDTDPNSKCQSGKFGHFTLTTVGSSITFTLNIDPNGINGTGHQCLTYFYYLPNISNTNQNIKVRVQETGDDSKLIDTVTNSPHNGWIERRITYETVKTGYKVYFDLGKTSGFPGPLSTIAFDEISIVVGKCSDESVTISPVSPVTTTTTTTTSKPATTTTEEETTTTTTIPTTVTETSTMQTTTAELTTLTTTRELTTIESTTVSTSTTPLTIVVTTTRTTTTTTVSTIVTTTPFITQTSTSTTTTVITIPTTTISTIISSEETTTVQQMTTLTTMINNTTSKSTTSTSENSIEQKTDKRSSNKALIISLACGIPAGLLIIVVISIWVKKATASGLMSSISHPFTNLSDEHEMTALQPEYTEDHYF